ncbi:MAG: sulfite exporter TauE/SafE family protein [Bacteroidota bacterium]
MELYAAFTIGLLGSLHCVGMCGPLMLTANASGGWTAAVSYQAGRLLTYVLLGALLGGLGLGMRLWNAQGVLALVSGGVLVVLAVMRLDPGDFLQRWRWYAHWQVRLRTVMASLLTGKGPGLRFALGACNGLLPCGLVYLAVIGATNMASPLQGAGFMLAFGLGTVPLLAVTLLAGKRLFRTGGVTLRRWTPVVMAAVGLLLLWRGYASHVPNDFYQFQDLAFPPRCH